LKFKQGIDRNQGIFSQEYWCERSDDSVQEYP